MVAKKKDIRKLRRLFDKGNLKEVARFAHAQYRMLLNKVEWAPPVFLTVQGAGVISTEDAETGVNLTEDLTNMLRMMNVLYASSFIGCARDADGVVTHEDVIFTVSAKGNEDKIYQIVQPFTKTKKGLTFGKSMEQYGSRSEAMKYVRESLGPDDSGMVV